jgi:hypothetical protein
MSDFEKRVRERLKEREMIEKESKPAPKVRPEMDEKDQAERRRFIDEEINPLRYRYRKRRLASEEPEVEEVQVTPPISNYGMPVSRREMAERETAITPEQSEQMQERRASKNRGYQKLMESGYGTPTIYNQERARLDAMEQPSPAPSPSSALDPSVFEKISSAFDRLRKSGRIKE